MLRTRHGQFDFKFVEQWTLFYSWLLLGYGCALVLLISITDRRLHRLAAFVHDSALGAHCERWLSRMKGGPNRYDTPNNQQEDELLSPRGHLMEIGFTIRV